ncbi:MAG: hypothetical protein AB1633_13980, partial [Elusimicrobiota bacterium]
MIVSIEACAWFAAFILNLALAVFVFFRDTKNKLFVSFALFCICVSLWDLNVFGSYIMPDLGSVILWEKLSCAGLLFIPPTGFYFFSVFAKFKK